MWRARNRVDMVNREVMAYLSGARGAADGARAAGVSAGVFMQIADAALGLLHDGARSASAAASAPSPAQSSALILALARYLAGVESLRDAAGRAGVPRAVMARLSSQCMMSVSRLAIRALLDEKRSGMIARDSITGSENPSPGERHSREFPNR